MLEHSRLTALCIVPTIMLVMSWVTVMLRCWVKKRILKTFTLDDWFMLLSLALFTVMVSLQYKKTSIGLGQHILDLTPDAVMEFLKIFYISQITYILLAILLKTSISIFLLRISLSRTHRAITHVTLGIYAVASLYFVASIVTQCAPAAFFWDKTLPGGGTCQTSRVGVANTLASAALSAGTDLVYSLLPLWLIRNLQMGLGGKVSVAVILSMGLLSTAATCVRFKYIVPLTSSNDFTYDVYGIEIWSTIEPGLGITAASAATLRPLLRLFTAKLGLGTSATTNSIGGLNGAATTPRNFGYGYRSSRVPISLTTIAGGRAGVSEDLGASNSEGAGSGNSNGNGKSKTGRLREQLKSLSKSIMKSRNHNISHSHSHSHNASNNNNAAIEDLELGHSRDGTGPGSGRWNSASTCGRSEHSSSSEATKVGDGDVVVVDASERGDKGEEGGGGGDENRRGSSEDGIQKDAKGGVGYAL